MKILYFCRKYFKHYGKEKRKIIHGGGVDRDVSTDEIGGRAYGKNARLAGYSCDRTNPTSEPMAQLLEAMLIAQSINENGKPIYGCQIIGKNWTFVTLEGKTYSISKSFDCTEKDELLQIIAILRKFRYILETELLD